MTEERQNKLNRTRTIYAIRCKANGKVYIGSATDVKQRWSSHLSALRTGTKGKGKCIQSKNWQDDYNKFGADGFEIYIIEENIKYADSYAKESYYIDFYDSCNPQKGYNATASKAWHSADIDIIKGMPPKL